MSRIATGVSKKENRDKVKGLNLFFEWREKGLVKDFNEILTEQKQNELAGVVGKKSMTAIMFAVQVVKGRNK
jgi:hypothetical protein